MTLLPTMNRRAEMVNNSNSSVKSVCRLLTENNNFAVYTHENPDADTVGSCFALVLALRLAGKRAYPVCCDKIPVSLTFLTGGERNFFEEELPPDFSPVFRISVDVASPSQLGKYMNHAREMCLVLDHHKTHESYAPVRIVDSQAAACAEIVYRLVNRLLSGRIPEEIASLLYAALAADTGGFRYANTTPFTHKIAAKLIEHGANHASICRDLFECKTKSALAAEAFAMANVQYFCGGKISYVCMTEADKKAGGFDEEDTYDVINAIRRADGVKVAVFVRERADGSYKISTRSSCDIDVSKICAIFGGGGHFGAAGCVVSSSEVDSAVKRIIKECGFDE